MGKLGFGNINALMAVKMAEGVQPYRRIKEVNISIDFSFDLKFLKFLLFFVIENI